MNRKTVGGITLARPSSELIPEDTLEKAVEILKAVSNPIRLQIVNILVRSECQVGELINTMGIKQSLTSQQLSKLRFAGVLKSRRNGNVVFYSLQSSGIKNIMASILAEI